MLTKIEILFQNAIGKLVGASHGMARHDDDVVAKAREMYAAGVGYRSIGKALGVHRSTVQSWVGKSGNKRRNVEPVRIRVVSRTEKLAP
ncbi:MAG: hypothetical protein BGP21_06415 [Thiobacillus sp. 65-29]|nr:MAG: hypothetical protein BGP21_06415 [Thiobacillus sp. 65-29]